MKTHGMYGTPTYNSWDHMKQRCENPNNDRFHQYGGAGVTVCERWSKFENFLEDMGVRPEGCTLNRVKGADIYSKETCEWATISVQCYDRGLDSRNRTGVRDVRWRASRSVWESKITVQGVKYCLYYGRDFFEAVCRRKSAELKYFGFSR